MRQILILFCFLMFFFFNGMWTEGKIAFGLDRCLEYISDVRIQHVKQFGYGYPYWYGVGQLRQESACRADVTAFDRGQGIAQFMPKTAQYINSLMKANLNPYNPQQAIRMQAFYMALIQRKENWNGALFVSYQIYNGGRTLLYKEYQRAGSTNWALMKEQCQRKKIILPKGNILDFCEVNYDYSQRIYRYGQRYKTGRDIPWRFW